MLFLVKHLFSNKLSTIATISSLDKLEFFPACFPCKNKFNLFHNSSGFSDKNFIVTPEAIIAGDLSILISVLSLSLFRPLCLLINSFLLQTRKLIFDPVL